MGYNKNTELLAIEQLLAIDRGQLDLCSLACVSWTTGQN